MAQKVAKSRAAMDLKLSILSALNKLADRDTQQIAVEELIKTAENLQPDGISVFLTCLYEISPDQKSMVRREGVKLLSILASLYGELLTPHLQKILGVIIRRLKESDSNIRDACVDTMGTLVAHVPAPAYLANGSGGNADQVAYSGPLGVFTKPLFDALNEQTRNVQIGAAMCLARAMDNARELPPACTLRLCLKILKILSSPTFNAKAALLPALGGLARASGGGINQHLVLIIPCLQEQLQSSDWATRKGAADTFGAVALSVGGPPLTGFKTSTMGLLESYRFDKVKPARDSVVDAIHIWRNVPDPPVDASPARAVSSKSSDSNGAVIRNSRRHLTADSRSSSPTTVSPATEKVAAHAAVDKGSAKKKTSSSVPERKTNLDFFRKLSIRNSDEWQIEVAVPRGSPPASHNKENREETVVQPLDKVMSNGKVAATGVNGSVHSIVSSEANSEKEKSVLSRRTEVLVDKFEAADSNRAKEDTATANARTSKHTAGLGNATQWAHSNQQQQPDAGSGSVLAVGVGSNEQQRQSASGAELVSIGRQLSQLERGQSNLMEILQEFMGNSQESTLSLESRVQRLERALEDMARITAVSLGTSRAAAGGYFGGENAGGFVGDSEIVGSRNLKLNEANGTAFSDRHFNSARSSREVGGYRAAEASVGSEAWSARTSNGRSQFDHSTREFKEDFLEGEQHMMSRRPWDRASGPARLGEGPSARSVWRASKDEATLAAIRVAGAGDAGGPLSEAEKMPTSARSIEASSESTPCKNSDQANGSWNVWCRVLNSLHSGDLDTAYEEVICTGDELLMVRLMNRTGPILEQLSSDTVGELLHSIAQFLQQPSFLDCALPWIRQITEMVRTNGPKCLALSVDVKKELISSLHEASMVDFPERWMGSAVSKMANQLGNAWMIDLQ